MSGGNGRVFNVLYYHGLIKAQKKTIQFGSLMRRLTYFPTRIFSKRLSLPNPIELAEAALKISQIYCRLPNDDLPIPSCLISFH